MNDRYAINLAKTEIREGYAAADPDRILAQYAPGLIYFSEGSPSFYEDEAHALLRAELDCLFHHSAVRMVPLVCNVELFGATATAFGTHHFHHTPHDGSPARTVSRRYVEFWRKQADGCWRIALFLDNNELPPVLLPEQLQRIAAAMPPAYLGTGEVCLQPPEQTVAEAKR